MRVLGSFTILRNATVISGFAQTLIVVKLAVVGHGCHLPGGSLDTEMECFRCIHASRLLLNHQLHVAGEFEPAVQKIVADATLTAFDRVVDEALQREVDCLLISGDCLEPGDRGLRGPAALIRGISRLAERETPVILHSAPRLWSTWPTGLRWPPHAHRLGTGLETSESITREGKLLATVSADGIDERHAGWQIRLPRSSGDGRTYHLPDDPGAIIGLHAGEIGSHGCAYIEIDPEAGPRRTLIPVAPVRWERCTAAVAADSSRDDLLQDLASQLEQIPRHASEQVWLVTWIVSGSGPLLDRLAQPVFRDDFLDDLKLLDPVPGVVVQTHAIRLHETQERHRPDALTEDLAAEFATRLDARFAQPAASWRECLGGPALHGGACEVKLDSLFAEFDASELAHDARRLAQRWFGAEEDLSS